MSEDCFDDWTDEEWARTELRERNPRAPFPDASPLTDDLDGLHEPMDAPVKLREPNEADVILAMTLEWGTPMAITRQRLAKMNFEDFAL